MVGVVVFLGPVKCVLRLGFGYSDLYLLGVV
jgi:hypothetical protein